MDADFGTLVDFLRGELDSSQAAKVRARLEEDEALFQQFERLRRTYAVLRSMPALRPAEAAPAPETIPLTQPREEFVRDVREEFQTRGLSSLIPHIVARPQYVSALRVEFCVRAVCASLPMLVVGESFLQALRAVFAARTRVDSLPFIKARPAWIKVLRTEFTVRALVASIPQFTPRPEFVQALRAEFKQRALVGSVPDVDVRAGFERRLKVALVEASREPAEAAVLPASVLPGVEASDPFRRRLYKKILVNSHRRVRETPKRVDISEYQLGRELRQGFKESRRSIGLTFALHALAIVVMLFVFVKNAPADYNPRIAVGESEFSITPALPEADSGDVAGHKPERYTLPALIGSDWNSSDAVAPLGVKGDDLPDRDWHPQDVPTPTPVLPERQTGYNETLSMAESESASSFFRLRGLSKQQKIDYLGSAELYEALDKSLAWLARMQQINPDNDGSWGSPVSKRPELIEVQKLEMTAAAVLAFLGDGHSSEKSPLPEYSIAVKRGIAWLLSKQRPDGQIGPSERGNVLVHAMATLALAEEFGLTRANHLREPLKKACRWLCAVKAKGTAGFPFLLDQEASMSTSVWAYMALATARNVKVPPMDLPQARIDEFLEWYEAEAGGRRTLSDDLVLGHELLADAAAGAMSHFALERDYSEKRGSLFAKVSRELPNLSPPGEKNRDNGDIRFLFFGSQLQALNMQRTGSKSNEWYTAFKQTLLQNQRADGTWAATSEYAKLYGDEYTAAMACLSIENAYRVSIIK